MNINPGTCAICGGDNGAHGQFLGKPCPAGPGVMGPLMLAAKLIRTRQELAEIRELERMYRLVAKPKWGVGWQ